MASYTNRFHHCRSAALNLIHELLTLDTRLQEDENRALKNGNEKLHAAAVVVQYHLDYALERARAATVVPTNASGPAKPREHMENQDAYERFLGLLQTTGVAAVTAGKVNAFLTHDVAKWKAYADGS